MSYILRYSFDPGSGTCLWADSVEAKEFYGYAVDHWSLPLSENAKHFIQYLIAWFDTSIDWSNPGSGVEYWPTEELERFKVAAAKGLGILNDELSSSGYEFRDLPHQKWTHQEASGW